MFGADVLVIEGQRLLAGKRKNLLRMLIEAAEVFAGNPRRVIIAQRREEQLVDDAGDGAVFGLRNLRQLLIHMERNFDGAAVFAGWHDVLLSQLLPGYLPWFNHGDHTAVFTGVSRGTRGITLYPTHGETWGRSEIFW